MYKGRSRVLLFFIVKIKTQRQREKLCYGKGEPYGAQTKEMEQPGQGNQKEYLTEYGDCDTGRAPSHTLEINGEHDQKSCRDKAHRDNTQRSCSNGENAGSRGKNTQQGFREKEENSESNSHDGRAHENGNSKGLLDFFIVSGAIKIADHRKDYLLKTKQGDEEEGLQLIINAKYGDGIFRELFQDQIQSNDIDGVQSLSQDCSQTALVDAETVVNGKFTGKRVFL